MLTLKRKYRFKYTKVIIMRKNNVYLVNFRCCSNKNANSDAFEGTKFAKTVFFMTKRPFQLKKICEPDPPQAEPQDPNETLQESLMPKSPDLQ
jgi:hypothetical protein